LNSAQLITTFDQTMDELINLFSTFSDKDINTVPYKDSWTPGQMAAHVNKVTTGFYDMLNGPVKDTDRQPDKAAAQIKEDFLNFDIRMDSPDFVRPEIKDYDKGELTEALIAAREKLVNSAKSLDLTKTCTAFKPGPDWLTRYEALTFVTYHNRRHIHQLKKMEAALN
ncbi:MAG: DinB family protein, partial [Mucilaginibacter sp.]